MFKSKKENCMRYLLETLLDEKEHGIKGSIYNKLQVDMAYNSNHIEGSTLSHDQTKYIYETKSISGEGIPVEDIVETSNHFRCFDYILDHVNKPLSEEYIKKMHEILKSGSVSSASKIAVIGDYKKYPNEVNDLTTSSPKNVAKDMNMLLSTYENKTNHTLESLLDFHAKYEKIHPFYDGNGRTGRLLLFKECIRHNIIPFIIADNYKEFYYRGLKEWQTGGEKGFLTDTCLLMQDNMKLVLRAFEIEENTPKPLLKMPEIQVKNKERCRKIQYHDR